MMLNEEYAVVCKGFIEHHVNAENIYIDDDGNKYYNGEIPDYLSSDAELGRMVKALNNCEDVFLITIAGQAVNVEYQDEDCKKNGGLAVLTPTEETAQMSLARACIAFKLQIGDGND